MSSGIDVYFDRTELQAVQATFRNSTPKVIAKVPAIAKIAAKNMENGAKTMFRAQSSGKYFPHYPNSITSEVEVIGTEVLAIAGPEWGRPQGTFGQMFEHGGARMAPRPHLVPAMMQEQVKWGAALTKLAHEALT